MNIHIKDENLFKNLKAASLFSCEFGSKLYKTNDSQSDTDIHYIYCTSDNELKSFTRSHHHLQYKENGVDHIFVSLHTFMNNILKGDSTVLFELLFTDNFKASPLEFLNDIRNSFINYPIIRSYLGLANRDHKYYHKKVTHRDQIKTISHIYRGYFFAKSLLENNFSLVNKDFLEVFAILKQIGETDFKEKKKHLTAAHNLVSNLRIELNDKFNNGNLDLPRFMLVENQAILDICIKILMNSNAWQTRVKFLDTFDMNIFYETFENYITYE